MFLYLTEVVDRSFQACLQPPPQPDSDCQLSEERWYNDRGLCMKFNDRSCKTNRVNSFSSLRECMEQCSASAGIQTLVQ